MEEPDITPGWQERADELRKLIRDCQHTGGRERNEQGQLFCADCGRWLNEDGSES